MASWNRINGEAGQCTFTWVLLPAPLFYIWDLCWLSLSPTSISLLRSHQQGCMDSPSLMWRHQHKRECSPQYFSVVHKKATSHDNIFFIYNIFHSFHLSEQNKISISVRCCLLVKQISITEFLLWNAFCSDVYSEKYISKVCICF